VVALLAARPGERILDLRCGDGALTEQLAAFGCTVVGVDAGPDMVAAARRRGLEAHMAGGEDLPFLADFDAVFSNAALHWMRDADAVLRRVRRALRPGGRFVGEFGGHGNVAAITVALVAVLTRRGIDGHVAVPWYFPSAGAYAAKLEAHGFAADQIDLIPGLRRCPPTWPAGSTGSPKASSAGCPRTSAAARDQVLALLAPYLCDERGDGPQTTSGCVLRHALPAETSARCVTRPRFRLLQGRSPAGLESRVSSRLKRPSMRAWAGLSAGVANAGYSYRRLHMYFTLLHKNDGSAKSPGEFDPLDFCAIPHLI
jgi:SAM-dependent methyltransferase